MSINEIRVILLAEMQNMRNFSKFSKYWLLFSKMCIPQTSASTDILHKNVARKVKFGLAVPIYGF